ncbi:hypothetical protein U5A82_02710 [Sphingobium sp. CR2-8]|uniref:hypothetical protein n=1 Tax=Sphingobium sp. CR2-8 TaxID=1306534 RepID=UPI002DB613F0|nr:hypothetical protein [Sphingobium sp. CR2-8]MEC3909423.1 hypothetical protein [Sphingobium sp. CR2-8]
MLGALGKLIDWALVAALLDPLYSASKGEPASPSLAMFKALLLSIWTICLTSSRPRSLTIALRSAAFVVFGD